MTIAALKEIRKIIKSNVLINLLYFCLVMITAILCIYETKLISKVMDIPEAGRKLEFIGITLGVFGLRIILTIIAKVFSIKMHNYAVEKLSSALFEKIITSRKQETDHTTASYLTSRAVDEAFNINGMLDSTFINGVVSFVLCIGCFFIMAQHSIFIVIIVLLFIITDYIVAFSLPLYKIFKDCNESLAKLRSYVTDTFGGNVIVKLGNRQQEEMHHYSYVIKEFLSLNFKKSFYNQIQQYSGIVFRQIGFLSVILLSAILMSKDKLSIGQFAMIISLYNIIWSQIGTIENMIPLYKESKASCERLNDILNIKTEDLTKEKVCESIKKLELKNIEFCYEKDKKVLNGISIVADRGKIVSITGASGSGKSTILNIIIGQIIPQKGHIDINGEAIDEKRIINMRNTIGYVGQENYLFNRSLKENLLYYTDKDEQELEKVQKLIKLFGLEGFINNLPNGIDTIISEKAKTISGGERQRLCIIRELMKNPKILILDEWSAHLDIKNESLIFNIICEICHDAVILQVTHRITVLEKSDYIYVMGEGSIVAEGTHKTLAEKSFLYQKLLNDFRNEEDKKVG